MLVLRVVQVDVMLVDVAGTVVTLVGLVWM